MRSVSSLFLNSFLVVAVGTAQPLLADLSRYHGAADPTACLFVLPVFGAMLLVGCFTCKDKRRLSLRHWRRASFLCLADLAHQILEKAGLVYAGGVLYLMAASLSLVWVALLSLLLLGRRLSPLQWLGLLGVVAGFCLRVAELEGTADAVGPHVAQELFGVALVTVAQILPVRGPPDGGCLLSVASARIVSCLLFLSLQHGLAFVLSEKYMKDTKDGIEGPELVFMCGRQFLKAFLCLFCLLLMSPEQIFGACYMGLFVCSLIRSGVLWVILKHLGSVSAGVLKAVLGALVYAYGSSVTSKMMQQQQQQQATAGGKDLSSSEAYRLLLNTVQPGAKGDTRGMRA
ncbi:hypothetical protein, conserved [Eimeria acervulina]|uniref:EamA domain-containing protein n=1 Tax=Eimeria acervulina TaxID=5801 RepID=U6GJS5_EIMAC|nr:hypothetical protein, conserved [Eimeria acervulina]CDI78854.1 hypothetical protein, conserved [Eimeria acervulina]